MELFRLGYAIVWRDGVISGDPILSLEIPTRIGRTEVENPEIIKKVTLPRMMNPREFKEFVASTEGYRWLVRNGLVQYER